MTEEKKKNYDFTQKRSDYLTSNKLLEVIFDYMTQCKIEHNNKFDLDTCCSQKNIPADDYCIDGQTDGLTDDWEKLNYCNPPFKECPKWVKKAFKEWFKCKTTVMLIPARTETAYWHDYILQDGEEKRLGVHVKFLRKGYGFLNPDDNKPVGVYKNPLAIVIFDGRCKEEYRKEG